MKLSTPQFITDNAGRKLSVVLPYAEYQQIVAELEEKTIQGQQKKTKIKVSALRGKMSSLTNEQIDQQFKEIRNEWQ